MEEYSASDLNLLLQAASDFDFSPGTPNEESVKEFLRRFPLPVIIDALQTKADHRGVEATLVPCLERIFKTKYGASLIPHYMPFLQVGLRAESQLIRRLACETVSCLFENLDNGSVSPAQLIIAYDVYPPLLDCLLTGDELVAAAAMETIVNFASSPEGIIAIFPPDNGEGTSLRNVAAQSSSLGRVRILALIVKLFSLSHSVASVINSSDLLSLLESEVRDTRDTLVTLSVLELLYEMAGIQHGTEFMSKTKLLLLLSSITSSSAESSLRSRAMMICGRMLSTENIFMFVDESSVRTVISAIQGRLAVYETADLDECESAIEALGQIGSSTQGAALLFSTSLDMMRYVIDAAFDKQRCGKQQAALHALQNITGANRPENNKILRVDAEENLRRLIYEMASSSLKLTPSGLFLSVLQQESEVRVAAYGLVASLVARPWCLMEICSKQEVINIVTDPYSESRKIGMEAKYNCCQAIHNALATSTRLQTDPALTGIAAKLQEAVRRGPYPAQTPPEARPTVMVEQRF